MIVFKKGLCQRHKRFSTAFFYQAIMPTACGLTLLLMLVSCEQKTQEKKFFDVPGYFKGEINHIKNNFTSLVKTTTYNDSSSVAEFKVSEINWEKELGIFMECDINKPVYFANMSKISSPSHASEPVFGWYDQSEKLPVRTVKVGGYHYGSSLYPSTNLISIQVNKSNLISETTIDAVYLKDSMYEFKGVQKIKTIKDKNTFYIKGEFK